MKICFVTVYALMLFCLLAGCGGDSSAPPAPYTAFSEPEKVTILGYDGSVVAPFVSRDGTYLFFNDCCQSSNLFYGTFVNETTVQFVRELTEINTDVLEHSATLNEAGNFYFSCSYDHEPSIPGTLYSSDWNGSAMSIQQKVPGLPV